jgi:hypothetical protein
VKLSSYRNLSNVHAIILVARGKHRGKGGNDLLSSSQTRFSDGRFGKSVFIWESRQVHVVDSFSRHRGDFFIFFLCF